MNGPRPSPAVGRNRLDTDAVHAEGQGSGAVPRGVEAIEHKLGTVAHAPDRNSADEDSGARAIIH